MSRPTWDSWLFDVAAKISERATCPRASIGCVIVNPKTHRILGTGYNGAPAGQAHCTDVGCLMLAGHCIRATHAEVNAAQQVSGGHTGLVAYVYGGRDVCSHCASELYAVGVRDVQAKNPLDPWGEIRAQHLAWVRETFPDETIAGGAQHLADEAKELLADLTSGEEYADVRLLLWGVEDDLLRLVHERGIDLLAEVQAKHRINRLRTFKDRGDGVFEHVREVPA